jgi:hypothetical protein
MTFTKPIFCAAALALCGVGAQAAIVDGASFGADAQGERTLSATFKSVATMIFDVQTAGTLSSFTMWIDTTSNFLSLGEDLTFVLLGGHSGSVPDVSDELARTTLSGMDLLAGPTITGGSGDDFVAATWDMSGLGISALAGEELGFRLFPNGLSGQVKYNATDCGSGGASLTCDPALSLTRFQGTQTNVGNTGSGTSVPTFALMVDDGQGPAAVPLPAGLPLMLLGLGSFAMMRRRS